MLSGAFVALSAAFALVCCVLGIYLLRKPKRLFEWLKASIALACLSSAISLLLIVQDYATYVPLKDRKPFATVSIERLKPDTFAVQIQTDSFELEKTLKGDYWQVDAKIIRLKPSLSWLNQGSGIRLDRLSGRYEKVEDELNAERTVYAISGTKTGFDLWSLASRFEGFPGIEAQYGMASFMPMVDGGRFKLVMDNQSLIAIPENELSESAIQQWNK